AGGLRDDVQHRTRVEIVRIDVGLEAIAGREHDGALRTGFDQGRGDGFGVAAETFEQVEGGGLMTRRHAEQHPPRLRRLAMSGIRGKPYPIAGLAPGIRIAGDGRIGGMTDLLRALAGQKPERTPVWFMRQAGRSLPEYRELRVGTRMLDACLTPDLAAEITLQPVRRHGVDAAVFFSDIVIPLRLAGVEVEI